jgi:hypothetical protein
MKLLGVSPAGVADTGIPSELAGLSLVEVKTGDAAMAEVEHLHGQRFPLVSAAFARYGALGEGTLWVAEAENEDLAGGLLTSMLSAIAAGGTPFTPLAPQSIDGVTVYLLRGLGQEHIVFQSGRVVAWLAVDPALAEAARQTIVEACR